MLLENGPKRVADVATFAIEKGAVLFEYGICRAVMRNPDSPEILPCEVKDVTHVFFVARGVRYFFECRNGTVEWAFVEDVA